MICVGGVNAALSSVLPGAKVVASLGIPDGGPVPRTGVLAAFFDTVQRADCLVVTEDDVGRLILGSKGLLFAIRQKVRRGVLLPVRLDGHRVSAGGLDGFYPVERDGGLVWRWVATATGEARFTLRHSESLRRVTLRFTPWFSGTAIGRGITEGRLTVTGPGGPHTIPITVNEPLAVTIDLTGTATPIVLCSDLPSEPSGGDPRTCSLALCQPEFWIEDQLAMDAERFLGQHRSLVLLGREALHRAGFTVVQGMICGKGDLAQERPLQTTASNPLRMIMEPERLSGQETDPVPTEDAVAWLAGLDGALA